MAWKNIKDHYRIEHIVRMQDGVIKIGSGYVPDLISVTLDGVVSWGSMGECKNEDIARYYSEMTSDLGKLRELIAAPDTFKRNLRVFTYKGSQIIEKQCEEYAWPNVTHDGLVMYANSYSPDKAKVVEWAKKNAECGIEWKQRRIAELKADLVKMKTLLSESKTDLEKLEADFPANKPNENPPPSQ